MNLLDLDKEEIFGLLCAAIKAKGGVITLEKFFSDEDLQGQLSVHKTGDDLIMAFRDIESLGDAPV